MTNDNTEQAKAHLVQELTKAGFTLGEDFSIGGDCELLLSPVVTEYLRGNIPAEDIDKFNALIQTRTEPDNNQLIDNIEAAIGRKDFFSEHLPKQIKKRLREWMVEGDFLSCCVYACSLSAGIARKFPELDETLLLGFLLNQSVPEFTMAIVETIGEMPDSWGDGFDNSAAGYIPLDLARAIDPDLELDDSSQWIPLEAIRLASRAFEAPDEAPASLTELILKLERMSE